MARKATAVSALGDKCTVTGTPVTGTPEPGTCHRNHANPRGGQFFVSQGVQFRMSFDTASTLVEAGGSWLLGLISSNASAAFRRIVFVQWPHVARLRDRWSQELL